MSTAASSMLLESRVLGAILARGDLFHELPAGFSADLFERVPLRRAFDAIQRMAGRRALPAGELDVTLVLAEAALDDANANDLRYAVLQADLEPSARSVADNAQALMTRRRRERMAALFREAAQELASDVSPEDVGSRVAARLMDIDRPERPETVSFRDAAASTIDLLEKAKMVGGQVLKTGFVDIDKVLKIRKGNLIVLAARPGMGKTTLAFNIADNVAVAGGKVLFHSLEMDDSELVTLALSRASRIDSQEFFEEKQFTPDQWNRVATAIDKRVGTGDGNLLINASYSSLGAICRITEKAHRKHGLSLVFVDYLQLVEAPLGKNATRENQVSAISRTLKTLAQRLQVPIIALSQLNRESVKRGGATTKKRSKGEEAGPALLPRPQLHDLRESGAIEQDANAVVFLHNPHGESADEVEKRRGPFEVIVEKQRLGKRGVALMTGFLEFAEFRPCTNSSLPPSRGWSDQGGEA